MPINVCGNSNSYDNGKRIDTSLFVQKPYLRTNYLESNTEENLDLKNQYKIKHLPDPTDIQDACRKQYVDNKFNNPSIIKNTAHIDLNGKKVTNARFIQVNQLPQIDSHLTAKLYVDNLVDEVSLVRNNQNNDFGNYNSTNKKSITSNKQAENDNEVNTKAYVDQFHQENEQSRRDLGTDFYDESSDLVKNNQDNDLNVNKLTNFDSVIVNRNPTSDNELSNKKYVDDQLDKNTIVRFNQTLQNYLKVSVGSDTYNLTEYDNLSITDVTEIISPSSGIDLLQKRKIDKKNKNGDTKIGRFIKSAKTSSPTGEPGETILPPIGNAFMYIETSSNNHGAGAFVSFGRTDIIQITNLTLYYNRFSILTVNTRKSMGRFRIQFLLEDNTSSTRYNIPKNDRYSDTSADWTLVNLNFAVENYGINLIYDQIDTAHADMCLSKITITHSVY